VESAEQPLPRRFDDTGRGQPAAPAEPSQADDLIAALLVDLSCPGRSRRGGREIEVDRFLAFAYSRGLSLAGLERRVDRVVKSLGGHRADPATPAESFALPHRASRLPVYRLPEDAGGPAAGRTDRHSVPARAAARTDVA